MGMGYAGCRVDVLSEDYLESLFGERWKLFKEKAKNVDGYNWWHSVTYSCMEDFVFDVEDEQETIKKLEQLNKEFAEFKAEFERLHEGLSIAANYHNSCEEGSRYDDVNGGFVELTGVWKVSEAAQKIKSHWDTSFFVQFG